MERGIMAMRHILDFTHNSDIRRLGTDYFFQEGFGILPDNFRKAMPEMCDTSIQLVKLAYHFYTGGCLIDCKERDYTLRALTYGLDSENSRLVVEAVAIYLGVEIEVYGLY
jgi:hypothetical protein